MSYDSTNDTFAHIERVRVLMKQAIDNLLVRSGCHDDSKLEEPEKSTFDRVTPRLKQLTYGSDEYKAALADMGEALAHHYAHNSHHPQHYANGMAGMSLLDLIEMLADWKAAGERHANGSMAESLRINRERFGADPVLAQTLENTARELGWVE